MGGKCLSSTKRLLRAQDDLLHPVGPVGPLSSVEKPVPLSRDGHQACLRLGEDNLHGLVDPEGVCQLVPAVRVLARAVVCIDADRPVLVDRG